MVNLGSKDELEEHENKENIGVHPISPEQKGIIQQQSSKDKVHEPGATIPKTNNGKRNNLQ